MNSAHSYSEGAEVPEDKTPKRVRTKGRKMTKDERWLLYTQAARMQERHNAIDECIHILETHTGDINLIPVLESLKNKPI